MGKYPVLDHKVETLETVESGNLKSLDEFHCAFLGNTKHKF